MRPILKAMSLTMALALVMAALAGVSWAGDRNGLPSPDVLLQALAEAGKPGPEHQKLQPFVGDWAFTLKVWTDPSQPPAEVTGTVERRWILGGRFIQESVQGEYKGKTFEGLGLLGYDNAQKKFTTVRACGLCGTISQGLATCDGSGTKFVCAKEECCPLTGQKIQGRDEILVENHDRIVTNMYRTVQGKEVKAMEIVSVRKR
jgi:Protein of unknown function (DUF1579)